MEGRSGTLRCDVVHETAGRCLYSTAAVELLTHRSAHRDERSHISAVTASCNAASLTCSTRLSH